MSCITPVSSLLSALLAAAVLPAQSWSTIPEGFGSLPGNAAVSMPLRWSWGRMQTIYGASLLGGIQGQAITRLRLRQPAMPDEAGDAALQVTLEVGIGEASWRPTNMSGNLDDNIRSPSYGVLFGPATVSVPAVPAPGAGDVVGATLVDIPLDRPFAVPVNRDLVVEWHAIDQGFSVRSGHWVDALWQPGGVDQGLALPTGQFGCGGRGATPMRLGPAAGSEHPAFGQTTDFLLTGGLPSTRVWLMFGFDPVTRQAPFPFGSALPGLFFVPGCYGFAPLDFPVDVGSTNAAGTLTYRLDLPASTLPAGAQIGVQALVIEGASIAASNGLVLWMDAIGVGDEVATAFAVQDGPFTFGLPKLGLCPIVGFGY